MCENKLALWLNKNKTKFSISRNIKKGKNYKSYNKIATYGREELSIFGYKHLWFKRFFSRRSI